MNLVRWSSDACLVIVLAGVAFGGCATQPRLAGAVYANSVPIYKNLSPRDQMGGHYEDENGNVTSQSQTWFFNTSDSRDLIVAYYKQRFPEATITNDEAGEVLFKCVPKGAEDGESVWVAIGDDGFRIGEACKPGKIKS